LSAACFCSRRYQFTLTLKTFETTFRENVHCFL